jgi:hypothetical protein
VYGVIINVLQEDGYLIGHQAEWIPSSIIARINDHLIALDWNKHLIQSANQKQ